MNTNNFYTLLVLIIILNITLRISPTPHEIGSDSFDIHSWAQSIIYYKNAKWIEHPLSFLGITPNTYPVGVPYLIATASIILNCSVENTIYFYSIFLALLAIGSMYSLATLFKKNELSCLFSAFIFSTSPIILKFSVWTASARGILIILMPMVLWSLISLIKKRRIKFLVILSVLILFLSTVHRAHVLSLFYLIGVILTFLLYKIPINIFTRKRYIILVSISYFISFYLFNASWAGDIIDIFGEKTRIISVSTIIFSRLGFIIFLSALGMYNILIKLEKTFEEKMILSIFLVFSVFVAHSPYIYQVVTPIVCILATYSIDRRVPYLDKLRINNKIITIGIIYSLLVFSTVTLSIRYNNKGEKENKNYLTDSSIKLANFINKKNIYEPIDNRVDFRIKAYIHNIMKPLSGPDFFIKDLKDTTKRLSLKDMPTSIKTVIEFVRKPFQGSRKTKEIKTVWIIEKKDIKKNRVDKVYDNEKKGIFTQKK